ncbi:MAG: hypothetical protein JWQ45_178 [Blastococcus sp.]|nr:hypothetical protein [Blastococcus sp.]
MHHFVVGVGESAPPTSPQCEHRWISDHETTRAGVTGASNVTGGAAGLRVSPRLAGSVPQQIADIVRVTVDDEVDTTTFRAIVSDVATDIPR